MPQPSVIKTRVITKEYEAGYEAAGLGTPTRKPGRTRYVYTKDGLVEVGSDWEPSARRVPVVGDLHYDGLRASDGTDVSSRRKHREYMKANNLALADDFKNTWAQAASERSSGRDPERRDQIGRAVYEAEKKGLLRQ